MPPRVTGFDQFLADFSNKSLTLPFENRKNIDAIALSPEGNVLLTVDSGESCNPCYFAISVFVSASESHT
jgi:hypothetical protein